LKLFCVYNEATLARSRARAGSRHNPQFLFSLSGLRFFASRKIKAAIMEGAKGKETRRKERKKENKRKRKGKEEEKLGENTSRDATRRSDNAISLL